MRLLWLAAASLAIAGSSVALVQAQSMELVAAAIAAVLFCVFLIAAPEFWLAVLLLALVPFEALITQSLGGFGSNARQLFAMWKEALLLVGIIRVLHSNANRRVILRSNRPVLFWSAALLLVYGATFLRIPSLAAVFSIDLETRFLAVMLFFMLLRLDDRRRATLLRVMLWSIGSLAAYGLIQYFWDYQRLLPLVYNLPDISFNGHRRLYSYSLDALEPAYAAMIAILIVLSGVTRSTLRVALWWIAILLPCLLLTYTRSAYLGLLAGAATLCIVNRTQLKRITAIGVIASCCVCVLLLAGGDSAPEAALSRRLESIFSQNDQSSHAHKERMRKAVQVVEENPLGIGLGKYGTVEARFAGGVSDASYTEDWELQVAVETGVIGALAYLALTAAILISLCGRRRRKKTDSKMLVGAAIGVFAAMTVAGIMIPVWDGLLPAVYTWALVGLALNASSGVNSSQRTKVMERSGL